MNWQEKLGQIQQRKELLASGQGSDFWPDQQIAIDSAEKYRRLGCRWLCLISKVWRTRMPSNNHWRQREFRLRALTCSMQNPKGWNYSHPWSYIRIVTHFIHIQYQVARSCQRVLLWTPQNLCLWGVFCVRFLRVLSSLSLCADPSIHVQDVIKQL